MSVTEASKELGLSAYMVRKYARAGLIAGTRDGRDWDFVPSSVKAFKTMRRTKGANAPMKALMKRGLVS